MAFLEEAEQTLADLIGDEAAFILVEQYGGVRLPVPKDPTKSKLPQLIGAEAAAKLSDAYAGLSCKVPLGKRWRIQVYRARGMSYAQIARAVGCSENQVNRTLKQLGLTKSQDQRDVGTSHPPSGRP